MSSAVDTLLMFSAKLITRKLNLKIISIPVLLRILKGNSFFRGKMTVSVSTESLFLAIWIVFIDHRMSQPFFMPFIFYFEGKSFLIVCFLHGFFCLFRSSRNLEKQSGSCECAWHNYVNAPWRKLKAQKASTLKKKVKFKKRIARFVLPQGKISIRDYDGLKWKFLFSMESERRIDVSFKVSSEEWNFCLSPESIELDMRSSAAQNFCHPS